MKNVARLWREDSSSVWLEMNGKFYPFLDGFCMTTAIKDVCEDANAYGSSKPTRALLEKLVFEKQVEVEVVSRQDTGFKDIEGKSIWEGDIIYITGVGDCEVILASDGKWVFGSRRLEYSDVMEDIERVVGNVYRERREGIGYDGV